jgi:hypothetical protein
MSRIYMLWNFMIRNVPPDWRDVKTLVNPVIDIFKHLRSRLLIHSGVRNNVAQIYPTLLFLDYVLIQRFGGYGKILPFLVIVRAMAGAMILVRVLLVTIPAYCTSQMFTDR